MTDLPYYSAGVVEEGGETYLQTSSGTMVGVLNPLPEQIIDEDIANALGKLCRYNGHTIGFYSVAQHSVLGVDLIQRIDPGNLDLQREFLMHDATEAYVGDLVRPVKMHIPSFQEAEDRFWKAIATKFNLPLEMTPECKYIDNLMCSWEKRDLIKVQRNWPGLPDISNMKLPHIQCWDWKYAQDSWMECYEELFLISW